MENPNGSKLKFESIRVSKIQRRVTVVLNWVSSVLLQPEEQPAAMVIILVINFSFTLSLTDLLSYRSDTAHQNDVNERNDDDCPAVIGNFGQLTPAGASLQPGYSSRQAACDRVYTSLVRWWCCARFRDAITSRIYSTSIVVAAGPRHHVLCPLYPNGGMRVHSPIRRKKPYKKVFPCTLYHQGIGERRSDLTRIMWYQSAV